MNAWDGLLSSCAVVVKSTGSVVNMLMVACGGLTLQLDAAPLSDWD